MFAFKGSIKQVQEKSVESSPIAKKVVLNKINLELEDDPKGKIIYLKIQSKIMNLYHRIVRLTVKKLMKQMMKIWLKENESIEI